MTAASSTVPARYREGVTAVVVEVLEIFGSRVDHLPMSLRDTGVVVAAGAVLALAACGGGGGSDAKSSTSSTSAAKQSSSTKAFVDVVTCDNAGGSGTSTGTIENQGSAAAAYTITIGFYDEDAKKVGQGTDTTATVAPGGSADWTVTASGLDSGDLVCHTLDIASGGGGTTSPTSATSATAEEFPCDIVSQSDVAQAVGNPVEPGDGVTNHVSEDDVTFTARECSWSASPGTAGSEARLQVSRAADNDGTDPGCPPYPGTSTPVPGLGTAASWSWTDPGTSETVGTLRVCSAGGLVDVTITGSTSGDAHLAAARAIAEQALAAL